MTLATDPQTAGRSTGYQIALVFMLSVNFGIVFLDRQAIFFLMPFIQRDLVLNNFQVGLLSSATSLTWAAAAFAMGGVSDRLGRRKWLLIGCTIAFSLCSWLSGIAQTFAVLLLARAVMGFTEGGILPISHALVASEVKPGWRGVAQGVTQNFGSNLFGSFIAPVLLASLALAFGWRGGFFIVGVPGLVMALVIALGMKEAPRTRPANTSSAAKDKTGAWRAIFSRNVILCALISVFMGAYLVVGVVFMPLFLTHVRNYPLAEMAWVMAALGLSATLSAFVIPTLSDYIGRKPVMVLAPLMGVGVPLSAMYFMGPSWELAIFFFVGWTALSVFPMFMATVPSESVNPLLAATVTGFCMGTSEIVAGVITPAAAGALSDRFGLSAALWLMAAAALLSSIAALGLRETAPRRLAAKKSATAPLPV